VPGVADPREQPAAAFAGEQGILGLEPGALELGRTVRGPCDEGNGVGLDHGGHHLEGGIDDGIRVEGRAHLVQGFPETPQRLDLPLEAARPCRLGGELLSQPHAGLN
jgi:hypothetical protein